MQRISEKLLELFTDDTTVKRIRQKLPYLFQIAELESQRAGKIGMEVGSIRERIIVSLLIYKFGDKNVDTEISITESEVDVKLFGIPISIKTKTGSSFSGVKLIWTVDAKSALKFQNSYSPSCDMIFVQINWGRSGGLFYFPLNVQLEIFNKLGRENYIKLPVQGTNPRGVEISSSALKNLIRHNNIFKIEIDWKKENIQYNTFKRWVDLWAQE